MNNLLPLVLFVFSLSCFAWITPAIAQRPKLQLINASEDPVKVFWVKPDGQRVANGIVNIVVLCF